MGATTRKEGLISERFLARTHPSTRASGEDEGVGPRAEPLDVPRDAVATGEHRGDLQLAEAGPQGVGRHRGAQALFGETAQRAKEPVRHPLHRLQPLGLGWVRRSLGQGAQMVY